MRKDVRLTAADARRLAIRGQRLAGERPRPTRAGVLRLVREIGYLQLDPTNVVARNPLQVVWTRLGAYDPKHLEALHEKRRELFETVSLIVPTSDLHIHGAAMLAYRRATDAAAPIVARRRTDPQGSAIAEGASSWQTRSARYLAANPELRRHVLSRIRRDGPVPLSAFEDRAAISWTSGGWNDERNVSIMLAVLQRRGEIVVAARRRGQKLYGLADGWYPKVRPLSGLALEEEATRRALAILGVATLKELRYQYSYGGYVSQRALDSLERAGEVVRVEIADAGWKGQHYALADVEGRLREEVDRRTTLLSPFDNLIIDRGRTLKLFDYFYRMEIYVPARLRKLGYWAMPVLHGDRIVGSVDPRMDRESGMLVVNRVVLRPGAPRAALPAIKRSLNELAEWLGADRVTLPERLA